MKVIKLKDHETRAEVNLNQVERENAASKNRESPARLVLKRGGKTALPEKKNRKKTDKVLAKDNKPARTSKRKAGKSRIPFLDTASFLIEVDENGRAPLHKAALEGNAEIAKFLIEKGAQINIKDRQGLTPLHYACLEGHLEVVDLLIEEGAGLNEQDDLGNSPLHFAVLKDHAAVVEILLQKGAEVNVTNTHSWTPLRLVRVSFERNNKVVRLLRAYGGKTWKKE